MHAWEAIQKTLDYIEEHIGDEIVVDELAEIAALSVFYYQRLFARLVKKPVREYIKLRRLARACDMLCNEGVRIVDAAVAYGFGSHETFTRAFKQTYGLTPAEYRGQPVSLINFDKPDLQLDYIIVDEGVPLISEGLVLEMKRKTLAEPVNFLGISAQFPFRLGKMLGQRPGVDMPGKVWHNFFQVQKEIPGRPGGKHIGVSYHGSAPDGYTTYFVGTEVAAGEENSRFEHWQLPAREYVVCTFEAERHEELIGPALGKAMRYTRFWLRNHQLTADGFFPELHHPDGAGSVSMELWIPFRPREISNN